MRCSKGVNRLSSSRILCCPLGRFYSSGQDNSDDPPDGGKPFSSLPRLTASEFGKRFEKGGEFYNLHISDAFKKLQKEFGDMFIKEGIAGVKRDDLVLFKPEHFKIVYQNEGRYPFRDGLDTLFYHRKFRRTDLYGANGGLAVE